MKNKYKVEHTRRAKFFDIIINDGIAGIESQNVKLTDVRHLADDFRQEMSDFDNQISGVVMANQDFEYPEEFKDSPSNYWRSITNDGRYFKLKKCVQLLENYYSKLKARINNETVTSTRENVWKPKILEIDLDKLKSEAISITMEWFRTFYPGAISEGKLRTSLSDADSSIMKTIYDIERSINNNISEIALEECKNQEDHLENHILQIERNEGFGIENNGIQSSAETYAELLYHRLFYKKCINLISSKNRVISDEVFKANKTSMLIIDELNKESTDGWEYMLKSKSDMDLLVKILTEFFEQSLNQIPKVNIRTKTNGKTALARVLGRIYRALSEEKLSRNKEFLDIIRLIDRFRDEPKDKIIKALQRNK